MPNFLVNHDHTMKGCEIEQSISKFLKYLEEQQYSKETINKFTPHLEKFKCFCAQNNIINFLDMSTLSLYFKSTKHFSSYSLKLSHNVLYKFRDFTLTSSFKVAYLSKSNSLKSHTFSNSISLFNSFLEQTEIKESTRLSQINIVKNLLFYFEKNKIMSFDNNISSYIYNYINSSSLAHATKCNYAKIIRKFFDFTFSINLTPFSGKQVFPRVHRNESERILSFYSAKEISKVISIIDTNTKNGKRDYIIILLAAVLGIRSSDISNLTIQNINWDMQTLDFIQQKTGQSLVQPFTDEIFYALLDYIKNARPKTNCENLFVTSTVPFRKLHPSTLSNIGHKYFKLANIDISTRKHGIHSLRHSFANNMLHNNVSLQDISASLGHSYISTTTMYTNIDIQTLKLLALEVE